MRLYCGQCTMQLTSTPLVDVAAKSVSWVEEQPLMRDDQIMDANGTDYQFDVEITHFVSTNCLQLVDHEDSHRLHGCCGPSMTDHYNQVCAKCKLEIGVLFADCMWPHFTAINMKRLDTQPKW